MMWLHTCMQPKNIIQLIASMNIKKAIFISQIKTFVEQLELISKETAVFSWKEIMNFQLLTELI